MKKILALALVSVLLIGTLVSCGAGGKTNMHKLMKAIYKDGVIDYGYLDTVQDLYKYESGEVPSGHYTDYPNADYKEVYAYAESGYYKHYLNLSAGNQIVTKDVSNNYIDADIQWFADDNTIVLKLYRCGYCKWDAVKNEWDNYASFEGGAKFTYDMNLYYENGKFETTDATAVYEGSNVDEVGREVLLRDCTALLNDALNGLNEVYGAKGYPIK